MAKPGQKTITLTGKTLIALEKYYKKELSTSMYKISFAEFVSAHALRDLERTASSEQRTREHSHLLLLLGDFGVPFMFSLIFLVTVVT